MNSGQSYDAIVIGGGPAGSTAAAFLARDGRQVLLLEKEVFPRFHLGESLLPYNLPIFEEMGVMPVLEKAGFLVKMGAQFHLGNSSKALKLVFRRGRFTRYAQAFQVERAKFDHLLLNHARSIGADVREGCTVSSYENTAAGVVATVQNPEGRQEKYGGRFLLDASGRTNLTGTHEQLRVIHPSLKKLAVFGHFENVLMDSGEAAADTIVVRLQDKWFWLIPLSPEKVSVGCVMDQAEFAAARQTPAEIFNLIVQSSTEMRQRMAKARLVYGIHITTDFSYYNRRLVGPRLARLGDAAGFMDPIFSAGVYLAMYSGKLSAAAVQRAFKHGTDGKRELEAYEKKFFRAMRYFWVMVEKFYTPSFIEIFMEPRPKFNLPDAVVAILAGELDGGWKLELRRKLFFLLLRLQERWPLVPRVSFREPPEPAHARVREDSRRTVVWKQ